MTNRLAFVIIAVLMAALSPMLARGQQQSPATVFTAQDASRLVHQMAQAVESNQRDKFLAAFDLTRMKDGPLFRQQVILFLSHRDYVRVHFNVTAVSMDGDKGLATVQAEMEADPPNDYTPPQRQRATLHLTAERSGDQWKFIDVQPRDFFSTSFTPPASR